MSFHVIPKFCLGYSVQKPVTPIATTIINSITKMYIFDLIIFWPCLPFCRAFLPKRKFRLSLLTFFLRKQRKELKQ